MRRRLVAIERLDDAQPRTAAWAWRQIGTRRIVGRGVGTYVARGLGTKQLAHTLDIVCPLAGREQAIVADAVEAFWEHVQQEAADEL